MFLSSSLLSLLMVTSTCNAQKYAYSYKVLEKSKVENIKKVFSKANIKCCILSMRLNISWFLET